MGHGRSVECPGRPGHQSRWVRKRWDQPRRSASQIPEQAPLPLPLHDPVPLVPPRRPLPVALLSPALTLTITAPFLATLPLMLMGAEPALTRLPLVMRTG